MTGAENRKVVRSYRVVFRRRWRVFRVQNWRIPLPDGIELRAIGYWLAALAALTLAVRIPLFGFAVGALAPGVRLLALPIAIAWALSRWELDGRSPHRALLGLMSWWLGPRSIAALRRCPPPGSVLAPLPPIALGADIRGAGYPRGRLRGPARVLLRYPVAVALEGVPRRVGPSRAERLAAARRWRVRATGGPALHVARALEVPAGGVVVFE